MQSFQDLPISEPLQRAICELGFTTPSAIQAEALPLLLEGPTDFLGLAATGTGKTAAFAIPILERLDPSLRAVQALVLCPTRELAVQVAGQIDLLGKHLQVRALPIYGGTGYGDQIYGLKKGAQIVVGTPGRVVDHLEKGTLQLSLLKTLVLDEADEMISMGFKEAMETVLKSIPKQQANTWLFSATMSAEVRKVAGTYLQDPRKVQINRQEMLPGTVEQIFFSVHERDKTDLLLRLIDDAEDFYGIIFCQTKSLVSDLTQLLQSQGYGAECLHGDLDQKARDRVMAAFRERRVKILVATDVACRGLDVKDVTHVVNYSIPRELDNYVHRIGRTGRSGKPGIAYSLVTNSHRDLVRRIEQLTKTKMKEGRAPSRFDLARKKADLSRKAFLSTTPATGLLSDAWKAALSGLSPEEAASRFLLLLHPNIARPETRPVQLPGRPPEQRERSREASRPTPRGNPHFTGKKSKNPPWERGGPKKSRPTPWGSKEGSPKPWRSKESSLAPRWKKKDRFQERGDPRPKGRP